MKSSKSYTKRLKITKNGKILSRKRGQNHFNAKERGVKKQNKRSFVSFNLAKKAILRFMGK